MKKSLLFVLSMSLFSHFLNAQHLLSGTILNQKGEHLPFATISLLNPQDSSLIMGDYSNEQGEFLISYSEKQRFILAIQLIGFQEYYSGPFSAASKNFGSIILSQKTHQLKEVVIRAERSTLETHFGKRILNVGADLANAGNSAIDILQNIPSLTVGLDGALSIRGNSGILIYINGKETQMDGLDLQQIPSDLIYQVEVYTNPPAKFDADGVAGVINIIFRKERGPSKLQFTSGIGLPDRIQFGQMATFKMGSFDFHLNSNVRKSIGQSSLISRRENFSLQDSLEIFENKVNRNSDYFYWGLNSGLKWQIDSTQYFDLDFIFDHWESDQNAVQLADFLFKNGNNRQIDAENLFSELENEFQWSASYQKKKAENQYFQLQLSHGGEDENIVDTYGYTSANLDSNPLFLYLKSSNTQERQRLSSLNLNISNPLTKNLTVELGGEVNAIKYQVNQIIKPFDVSIEIPENDFSVKQWKSAAYLIFQQKIKNLELGLGARIEHFQSNSFQESLDSSNFVRYLNVFPNIQLGYQIDLGEVKHYFSFTYSKRINRPGFFDLNPYINYQDPLNLTAGNPFLQPELADAYEGGYELSLPNWQIMTTLFVRNTVNTIQEVIMQKDLISLTTLTNFSSQKNGGLEMSVRWEPNKWLQLINDFTLFSSRFQSDEESLIAFNRQYSWNLRLEQNIKLPNDWRIQLSSYYRSPRIGPQIKYLSQYYLNIGIQKNLWNNRASFNISLSDVFRSRINQEFIQGELFTLQNTRRWQFHSLRLNFRYTLLEKSKTE